MKHVEDQDTIVKVKVYLVGYVTVIILTVLSVRISKGHSVGDSSVQSISQWIYRSGSLNVSLPARGSLALTFCRFIGRSVCQPVNIFILKRLWLPG
jgi:hypothetical protein